jgi:hypothetical protein
MRQNVGWVDETIVGWMDGWMDGKNVSWMTLGYTLFVHLVINKL